MGKRVIIECVGTKCNQRCVFCTVEHYRRKSVPEKDMDRIGSELRAAYGKGFRMVELIGGELSIRSDFPDIVRMAKRIGFEDIGLSTNMHGFADETYTREIFLAGVNFVYLSLHGHDARTHEFATRAKGSFDRAVKAIGNIVRHESVYNSINCVIHSENVNHLGEVCELILKLNVKNILFMVMDPVNVGKKDFMGTVPRYDVVADALRGVIGKYADVLNIKIQNLPPCFFEEGTKFFSKYDASDDTAIFLPDGKAIGLNRDTLNRKIKFQECEGCRYDSECAGYWKNYFKTAI